MQKYKYSRKSKPSVRVRTIFYKLIIQMLNSPFLSSFLPQPITIHDVPGFSSFIPAGGKQTGSKCSWKATLDSSWKRKHILLKEKPIWLKIIDTTNLKQSDVIIMNNLRVILWMWNNLSNFHIFTIVWMWMSSRYTQLYGPIIDVS